MLARLRELSQNCLAERKVKGGVRLEMIIRGYSNCCGDPDA